MSSNKAWQFSYVDQTCPSPSKPSFVAPPAQCVAPPAQCRKSVLRKGMAFGSVLVLVVGMGAAAGPDRPAKEMPVIMVADSVKSDTFSADLGMGKTESIEDMASFPMFE